MDTRRRVKIEENVADLSTQALKKAVISKHTTTMEYANKAEETVEDAWYCWDIGSGPGVREERQDKQLAAVDENAVQTTQTSTQYKSRINSEEEVFGKR